MIGLEILGLGHAVPQQIITNDMLARTVDTSDEWISSRTGIRERRFAAEQDTVLSLAISAAKMALEKAKLSPQNISCCLVATFTADTLMPSVACGVAQALGLQNASVCFDLNAACTGFVTALSTAHACLASQKNGCALVIGSEVISRVLDRTDRSTCVLFGDGAGAVVMRLSHAHPFDFYGILQPDTASLRCRPQNGGIAMNGPEVYRFATLTVPAVIEQLLAQRKMAVNEVTHFVCHQANAKIIEQIARRLGVDFEKFYLNLQRYGNTSAASIPIALSEMAQSGFIEKGSTVVCAGFGGGLLCAAVLLTW